MANYIHDVKAGTAYTFQFTNYKTATKPRHVIARGLRWGGTPWHPELQWFLEGFDLDKLEPRSFPLANIALATFRVMTDEEVDMFFTSKDQEAQASGYNKAIEEAKAAVAAEKLGD